MAKLVTLLGQHLDRQPPTVVTQATTWWETVLAHVKLQGIGPGVNLPVKVCFCVCKHEHWGEQTVAIGLGVNLLLNVCCILSCSR